MHKRDKITVQTDLCSKQQGEQKGKKVSKLSKLPKFTNIARLLEKLVYNTAIYMQNKVYASSTFTIHGVANTYLGGILN